MVRLDREILRYRQGNCRAPGAQSFQNATDTGQGSLVFFLFDLLHLDGENLMALPLVDRKVRLASLLNGAPESLRYNGHQIGHGPAFHRLACEHGLEGIVSKRTKPMPSGFKQNCGIGWRSLR